MSIRKTVAIVTSAVAFSIALIVILVVLLNNDKSVAPSTSTGASQAASEPNLDQLADLVNGDRTKAGEQPLVRDPALDAAAQDKCKDMVTNEYWDHYSPTGIRGISFIVSHEQGLYYGENLSANYKDAKGVNDGWVGSEDHRENILRARFDAVGYAICDVDVVNKIQPTDKLGLYHNVIVQFFIDKN